MWDLVMNEGRVGRAWARGLFVPGPGGHESLGHSPCFLMAPLLPGCLLVPLWAEALLPATLLD